MTKEHISIPDLAKIEQVSEKQIRMNVHILAETLYHKKIKLPVKRTTTTIKN